MSLSDFTVPRVMQFEVLTITFHHLRVLRRNNVHVCEDARFFFPVDEFVY